MTRDEIYKEIEGTLGSVPGPFEKMNDSQAEYMWNTLKETFLTDMSLGLKVNALVALGAAHALNCNY